MTEPLHTQFLRTILQHPEAREEITGPLGKVKTLKKGVSRSVSMIYVVRKSTARVEMWIYRGPKPHQVDEAKHIHQHFHNHKASIENAFGAPLNWNHGRRKTAYSIQFDYDEFRLEDVTRWPDWADRMVADMNRLYDALRPHFL